MGNKHVENIISPILKPNILLVDDKPANLMALEVVLGRSDYNLISVESGKAALEVLAKQSVDLILLDVQMPGMDGFETAKRVKLISNCEDIPIIFITAIYTENEFIKKGYAAGAVDYF